MKSFEILTSFILFLGKNFMPDQISDRILIIYLIYTTNYTHIILKNC